MLVQLLHRCGQPAQQQGRRIPPLSLERAFWMRISLVSAFLPEVTQQIHSLRARGVMSSQIDCVALVEATAFRRSTGRVWTCLAEAFGVVRAAPVEVGFLGMGLGLVLKSLNSNIKEK